MAKKEHLLAAIDIGTTKIVAIVGKQTENKKLEILGMSKSPSKGVKRGVVLNIEETVNAIDSTVTEVKKQTGINFKDVFVGIAGQHIKSVRNRGYFNRDSYDDEITKVDIQRLIDDMYKIPIQAGEEIIHVLPQNFIVDSETGVKNPVGMSGKRLEGNFHIVIGQIASAKNISKCINRVGLNVEELILEPLASSEAVLTEDEKEAGVALVDIGGGTTDIAVFYDDIIRHTAVIPFGGNVVTKDIKEGCSILSRQAESLKITFGSALGDLAQEDKIVTIPGISGRDPKEISFKSLAYIIQSRMEEIIDSAMFEIENSGVIDKLSAGIVFTGGGALLRHLPQLVKFRTGLDVRIGYPVEQLATESIEEVNQPMYSTSVGLLLKGYENKRKQSIMEKEALPLEMDAEEPGREEVESRPKMSLFSNLKERINDIFDENDSTM
ncbi:MAG TPA: cell division protein FtsA [Bacteroides sp.]|nr:cell division protein FtsA [Bacteroides sp.]